MTDRNKEFAGRVGCALGGCVWLVFVLWGLVGVIVLLRNGP